MKMGSVNSFFLKYTNIKFQENSSSGTQVVPCGQTDTQTKKDGQTDRYDEASSYFSQFYERA
jgi:hypothetical protein